MKLTDGLWNDGTTHRPMWLYVSLAPVAENSAFLMVYRSIRVTPGKWMTRELEEFLSHHAHTELATTKVEDAHMYGGSGLVTTYLIENI